MNLVDFVAGYVLFQAFLGQLGLLFRFDKLIILFSNVAGAFLFASAQSALHDISFAPPARDARDPRHREPPS